MAPPPPGPAPLSAASRAGGGQRRGDPRPTAAPRCGGSGAGAAGAEEGARPDAPPSLARPPRPCRRGRTAPCRAAAEVRRGEARRGGGGAGRRRVPAGSVRSPHLIELVLGGDAQLGVYGALQSLDDPVGIHLPLPSPAGSASPGAGGGGGGGAAPAASAAAAAAPPVPQSQARVPHPPRSLSRAIHRFATAGYRETGAALRSQRRLLAWRRARREVAAILLYG